MTYLSSLSFYEAAQLIFYVFMFGVFFHYGSRYADWTLKVYRDFLSRLKDFRFWRSPSPAGRHPPEPEERRGLE